MVAMVQVFEERKYKRRLVVLCASDGMVLSNAGITAFVFWCIGVSHSWIVARSRLDWGILGASLGVVELGNISNLFGTSNVLVHVQQLVYTRPLFGILSEYKSKVFDIDLATLVRHCSCLCALGS